LLSHASVKVKKSTLNSIGSLLEADGGPTDLVLKHGFVETLPALLNEKELQQVGSFFEEIQSLLLFQRSLWIIANICSEGSKNIQLIFDADLLPTIVEQLRFGDVECQIEAARFVANAMNSGRSKQIIQLLNSGAVHSFYTLLGRRPEVPEIRKNVFCGFFCMLQDLNRASYNTGMKLYRALMGNFTWASILRLKDCEHEDLREEILSFEILFDPENY
jgi:hypothetical protein